MNLTRAKATKNATPTNNVSMRPANQHPRVQAQCQERTRELPTREANTSDAGPETNQNTDSTDHREGQREEGQTDNTPDTTSPKGCIKGTIRPCKQPNQTAQNCFPGKQTCKSDETWGECQVTKVENPFATPQATLGEICNDNTDNNCKRQDGPSHPSMRFR